MRVGIISDTHGLLRPEAIKHLAGTDHIIHAGDIGAPEVIEGLRRIRFKLPIGLAILGRVDGFDQDERGRKRDEGGKVLCGLLAA
jgi:predicted phosphodiesterase